MERINTEWDGKWKSIIRLKEIKRGIKKSKARKSTKTETIFRNGFRRNERNNECIYDDEEKVLEDWQAQCQC